MNRLRRRSMFVPLLASLLSVAGGQSVFSANLTTDRYQIHDAGQPRIFEVAKDEVDVTTRAKQHVPQSFVPLPSAEAVRQRAAALSQSTGDEVELVLFEVGVKRNEFTRRILTKQVLVQLASGGDAATLATAVGAAAQGSVADVPGYFIFEAAETGGALPLAEALRAEAGVLSAEPLLARQQQKRLIPNDPMFNNQWHLRNTGQNGGTAGVDINVTNVWNTYRGTNIGIAIIDDGLQRTHPDLAPNYDPTTSTNINNQTADPSPNVAFDYHGTACAGVAAARGNNALGVSGAAFEARLAGIRLIGGPSTDAQEAVAMSRRNDVLYLKSNSWGPSDDGQTLDGPGPLTANALAQGVQTGRGGRGTIYVWAGGNGLENEDNANYDGYVNSIYTIGIAAASDRGQQSDYSEPGACIVVAAPSGSFGRQDITTTDLVGNNGYSSTDYTSTFSGTSSATPLAAGVIALILEANPNLGWRDVQEILMRSATKVSPADSDWIVNGGGFNFNHKFGAGLINAGAAVALATNWTNLGPQLTNSSTQSSLALLIPDDDPTGVTRTFDLSASSLRVEHVTVTVNVTHTFRGDLSITLISPEGTESLLAEPHADGNPNYSNWRFMSVRNWGESSSGTWTVRIIDEAAEDEGTLNSVRLDIYGTVGSLLETTANLALSMTDAPDPAAEGLPLTYTLTVLNNGPTNASAVLLTNVLPAGVTLASVSPSQGTATNIGNTVICTLGSLASNATATVTINVVPNLSGTITNTASVAAGEVDLVPANNSAAAETTVEPQIFNVTAAALPTSAIISWDTRTHATAQVEYGLTPDLTHASALNPALTTNHSVLLLGLVPNTNYFYRVVSMIGTNAVRSAVLSFSTDLDVIVDNPQARYSGVWTLGTSAPDKFGTYYQASPSVTAPGPSSLAIYTPLINVAGKYDVYLWYPAGANRTANAQVTVFFDGGSLVRNINQTINGGTWQLLAANVNFSAGTDGFAMIGNNTGESGKVVMADAMRWSYSLGQDSTADGSAPAWWLNYYFGAETDPLFDHDEDGYTTQQEYVLGTDPTNGVSGLIFHAEPNGAGFKISFSPVVGGRTYALETSPSLSSSSWTLLPDVPTVSGGEGVFNVASALMPARYYRLRVTLAP